MFSSKQVKIKHNSTTVEVFPGSISFTQQGGNMFTEFWGLINNAGICFIGNIEIMATTDIEKVINVNLMGPMTMCKTFLPLLRRGQGRILNISSNAGIRLKNMEV